MTYPIRLCPACGGSERAPLFRQHFAIIEGISIVGGYTVVACDRCGMVFADDIPTQAAFDHYYADASKYEYPQRQGAASPYDMARFTEIADLFAAELPDRGLRILDIGCSTGGLLVELQRRGYTRLTGIDPSVECVRLAHDRYGLDVRCGTIESLEAWGEQYDCIILSGVLEHIRDVRHALAVLRSRLSPQGSLFVEVPDARGFDRFADAPFQAFSTEHVNFFTAQSLAYTLTRVGFDVRMDEQNAREQTAMVTMANVSMLAVKSETTPQPIPDRTGRHAMTRYLAQSVEQERPVRLRVEALADSRVPFVVWGTGTYTLHLLATTRLVEANILAFMDANPRYQGHELCGRKIVSPETAWPADVPILIASVPFEAEIRAEITAQARPNTASVL